MPSNLLDRYKKHGYERQNKADNGSSAHESADVR